MLGAARGNRKGKPKGGINDKGGKVEKEGIKDKLQWRRKINDMNQHKKRKQMAHDDYVILGRHFNARIEEKGGRRIGNAEYDGKRTSK